MKVRSYTILVASLVLLTSLMLGGATCTTVIGPPEGEGPVGGDDNLYIPLARGNFWEYKVTPGGADTARVDVVNEVGTQRTRFVVDFTPAGSNDFVEVLARTIGDEDEGLGIEVDVGADTEIFDVISDGLVQEAQTGDGTYEGVPFIWYLFGLTDIDFTITQTQRAQLLAQDVEVAVSTQSSPFQNATQVMFFEGQSTDPVTVEWYVKGVGVVRMDRLSRLNGVLIVKYELERWDTSN